MTREQDLLAAIRADPDDDAPRAIYADLLAERGDPRGELIHLQLERSEDDDRDLREELLLRRYERQWTQAAGVRGARVSYRRGFPVALAGNPVAILASETALRTQPIVELIIDDIQTYQHQALADLITLPELADLRRLRIAPATWSNPAELLGELWRLPLANLRTLELSGNVLDDARIPALASAPFFTQIERLSLDRIPLSPTQLPRLFDHLPNLTALDLRAMRVGPQVASRIAALRVPLERLYLDGTELTVDGARAIFGSPLMRNVQRLAIGHDNIQLSVDTLAGHPHLGRLRMLGLFDVRLAPPDAEAIANGPFEFLTELNLTGNQIGAAGARALAASEKLASLETLYLTANPLNESAIAGFLTRTGLPALKKLGAFGTVADEPWAETRARFDDSPLKVV